MRVIIAALAILTLGAAVEPAQADPYKWCAVYSGGGTGGGGGNCYFLTIEQCRAQVSGVGGFCEPNTFYDGKPVMTPEGYVSAAGAGAPRTAKHHNRKNKKKRS